MSASSAKTIDKIISLVLVIIGFAFLGWQHPTDGTETVAYVIIILGGLNLTNAVGQQLLEKVIGSQLGNSPAPLSSSSNSLAKTSYVVPAATGAIDNREQK